MMHAAKKILLSALMMLVLINMASCGVLPDDSQDDIGSETPGDEIRIGIAFDSFIIERWERDRDIFVSRARDLGAVVNVQNANGSVERQKDQIRYLIEKKMDVIVIIAVDSSSLKKEVQEAKNAGIRVVAYDRLISDADIDLYISFDNRMVGKYMADDIISRLPEGGKIMKINGPSKDNNVALVNEGFDEEIEGHKITVFDTYYASEWNGEEAFEYLSANPDKADSADGVMCGNDSLAGQAVRYYAEKRRAGTLPIVGQDADLDACQRVVEGTQTMTVYKPIERLAKTAAECAISLAKGHGIQSSEVIRNGSYKIPYVNIPPVMVTKDNIDSVIIDSGFHLREDVYRKER